MYRNAIATLAPLMILLLLSACGSNSSSTTPTTVPNTASIFYAHNLVFRNSTTLSTGYNGFGQLGTGNLGNRSVLGPIGGNFGLIGHAIGGDHSVAFINNSTVRSWGYNAFGQLGNNAITYSAVPVKTVSLSKVKGVAAGAFHSLAFTGDDQLWAWGDNATGQLGVQTSSTPSGYSMVPVPSGAGIAMFSNISSIAAGGNHSLARANGLVWAWGFNGTGQLGIDPKTTGALAVPIPVTGGWTGVAGISSGGAFNYTLDKNGTVWAWGYNFYGQLGNNSIADRFTPVQVQKSGGGVLDNIVQVSAGLLHGLALDADGNVWAWGYNFYGQLGNNNNLDSHVAVKILTDADGGVFTGVTEIRAFGSSSMAKKGGAWYGWGDNTYGQLGNGGSGTVKFPTKMTGY